MVAIFLAAMGFAAGCSDSDLTRNDNDRSTTPKENAEAELAALWLSGDLIAPQALYETIRNDLAAIRAANADSTDMVSIGFFPPWAPSELLAGFSSEGVQKIRNDNFPELERLNKYFGLVELDTSGLSWGTRGSAGLRFSGRKHPMMIAPDYDELDDVMWAEPNGYIGDWGNVYPWKLDRGMSYLIRNAWGDCPAGCIYSVFWYFRVNDGAVWYVGRYQPQADAEPLWWPEARTAYYAYRGVER